MAPLQNDDHRKSLLTITLEADFINQQKFILIFFSKHTCNGEDWPTFIGHTICMSYTPHDILGITKGSIGTFNNYHLNVPKKFFP